MQTSAHTMAESASVQVFVRFRPLNKRELDMGGDGGGFLSTDASNIKIIDQGANGPTDFAFDRVLGVDTEQTALYDLVGRPVVRDLLSGYNGTIFASGQVRHPASAWPAPHGHMMDLPCGWL